MAGGGVGLDAAAFSAAAAASTIAAVREGFAGASGRFARAGAGRLAAAAYGAVTTGGASAWPGFTSLAAAAPLPLFSRCFFSTS